jgi:hypothetical protein
MRGLPIGKLLGFPFTLRQKRLAQQRKPFDEREFIEEIANSHGDPAAAALLWAHLQDWVYAKGFTPYPTDDLGAVFGIAEEELDEDLVLGMFQSLNVPLPSKEFLEGFGPVTTPLSLAKLVTLCREGAR